MISKKGGALLKQHGEPSALFNKMGKNRNTIFLVMCLMVHIGYFTVFSIMGAVPLAFINAISSIFYVLFLLFSKDREKSEKATVLAYFEIILFSTACECITRNTFGFIYFVVGMVPVLFYLCPSYGNKRFIFQILGVIAALMIHHTPLFVPDSFYRNLYEELLPYARIVNFVNLLITLFTVLYTCFFYKLELDLTRKELDYQSTHDPLTGLYNRRFLYDVVGTKNENQISVLLLDIDDFKKINDRFGHDTGDEVLCLLSSCLQEEKKNGHYPVRWGGEEFIVYYHNTDIDTAYKHAETMCKLISERVILPDHSPVTVTAGLASGKRSEFDSIVKKADEYLYTGKRGGKDCIVWYQNEAEYKR